jgi:streptogramin lyase
MEHMAMHGIRCRSMQIDGLLACAVFFMGIAFACHADETYRFERVIPALQQPWRFLDEGDVAIDSLGNVYTQGPRTEPNSSPVFEGSIRKFSPDGAFIRQFYFNGPETSSQKVIIAIALDHDDNIYVLEGRDFDSGGERIRKFTRDGSFVLQWGIGGTLNGQFNDAADIAIDRNGNVFVADRNNHRIQKFDGSGAFLLAWAVSRPNSVAVDSTGLVYVGISGSVMRYTNGGQFLSKYSNTDDNFDPMANALAVAVTQSGHLFVADSHRSGLDRIGRILVYSLDGTFLERRGHIDLTQEVIEGPSGIACDLWDNVYISDAIGIVKMRSDGVFVTRWDRFGGEPSRFYLPAGVTVDPAGSILVTDSARIKNPKYRDHRVEIFSPTGTLMSQFGAWGHETNLFNEPGSICLDPSTGHIYIGDLGNTRVKKCDGFGTTSLSVGILDLSGVTVDSINGFYAVAGKRAEIHKFTHNGQWLKTWGSEGSGPGQLDHPEAIAADASGTVFVADTGNDRIQRFNTNGQLLTRWGTSGEGPGEFSSPTGVATDSVGGVYVTDWGNSRIQKFTTNGTFVAEWGGFGTELGKFNGPQELAADALQNVYVADTANHRIQKFNLVEEIRDDRAVIVAAGGPFPGNPIWDHTQLCANFAYRALNHQGFSRDAIYYLSEDQTVDPDESGFLDDVDANPSKHELQAALTDWASGADTLTVYFVGPVAGGELLLNASELLSSSELASWLAVVQPTLSGPLTIVIDASQSASFLPALEAPNRIVVASAGSEERASFLNMGGLSFSQYFWTGIFNGDSVLESFNYAAAALNGAFHLQTPVLSDSPGKALAAQTHIGLGTLIEAEAPVIGAVVPFQQVIDENDLEVWADPVTDNQGVARVVAFVVREGDDLSTQGTVLRALPTVELHPASNHSPRWTAPYTDLTTDGTYQITFYARDRDGNGSLPVTTSVKRSNALRRMALIVAGGVADHPRFPFFERACQRAYNALRIQGYIDGEIRFLSPTPGTGVDTQNRLTSVETALTSGAITGVDDLVIYLAGDVTQDSFPLFDDEPLTASQLDLWLDALQQLAARRIIVLIEGNSSGNFLTALLPAPGKQRIVVTSAPANSKTVYRASGDISFSTFFWQSLSSGASIEQSARASQAILSFLPGGPKSQLDDNGNGLSGDAHDGEASRNVHLGKGLSLSLNEPLLTRIVDAQIIRDENSATLWAEAIKLSGTITRVWGYVVPPDFSGSWESVQELDFTLASGFRYAVDYDGFNKNGEYTVTVYARDAEGNVSTPATTKVTRDDTVIIPVDPLDINGDGVVDAVDVQLVVNAALGIPIAYSADVNGDGGVNAIDVQLVTNAALGLK